MILYAKDGKIKTEDLVAELNKIIHANYIRLIEYRPIYYKKRTFLRYCIHIF